MKYQNLEVKIIEKLNKLLKSYKLIIKPIYPNSMIYPEVIKLCNFGLFKLTDEICLCSYCWNTIYDMLFSEFCIFNVCHEIGFCKGDSLEEIDLKLTLMGI